LLTHVRVQRCSSLPALFAFCLITALAVFVSPLRAQESGGIVSGSVIDAATGKYLEGARGRRRRHDVCTPSLRVKARSR